MSTRAKCTYDWRMNKLAKAWKMRKPPGTLGLKKFGPGKIWVENVRTQNTCILREAIVQKIPEFYEILS